MEKKILHIEILHQDVYIEYTNGEIEYASFTKARKVIYSSNQAQFKYSCVDSEKSNVFLNTLLARYKISQDTLLLR